MKGCLSSAACVLCEPSVSSLNTVHQPASSTTEKSVRLTYSSAELLLLRDQPCPGLPRKIKRAIFYFRISNRQHVCSNQGRISVRITKREHSGPRDNRQRVLRKISFESYSEQTRPKRPLPTTKPVSSILLTNLRSVNNKIDEVSAKVKDLSPDIAVFTETWLDSTYPDSSLNIDGYTVCRKDRNRHGGGIMCYISDVYQYNLILASHVPCLSACDTEFLCISFSVIPLLVICVYHPFWNSPSRSAECLTCISNIIDHVHVNSSFDAHKLRVILCGDFNGLSHHYDEITRVTQLKPVVASSTRGQNILDQIFVSFPFCDNPKILPPVGKSDHAVVFWRFGNRSSRGSVRKVCFRKVTSSGRALFSSVMVNTDWLSLVKSESDLNSCAALLLNCLYALFDFCFPMRTVRMRSTDPPWMRPSLKAMIDDRDRAYSKGETQKHLRLRDEVVRHTKQLKMSYLQQALDSESPKKVWRSLRLVGRCRRSPLPSVCSAEDLSLHFAANFQTSSQQVPCMTDDLSSMPLVLSSNEVCTALRNLKNKSPGPDCIPSWVLRDFASVLSPSVTYIFNWSLRDACVPTCFKSANLTPIPKCPSPSEPSHFRPISLLPILSKVLERFVARKWILPNIVKKVNPSQFAYLPFSGSGTTSALTLMNHQILSFLDSSSGIVRVLTIDFSKAFDKVLHSIILEAAIKFRLPKEAIDWISSFLANRKQRVSIENGRSSSTFQTVLSGVPQGSVLGPLLFCMVVDDLHSVCNNSFTMKYADDLTILHFVRQPSDDQLQTEYNHVIRWSASRSLPVNLAKCCVMDISTKKSLIVSPVTSADGSLLPCVTSLRLLGVIFSSDMKWNGHVDHILEKCHKRIFLLRNLRRSNCPPSIMSLAYNSLLRSILLYAYPSFCNMPQCLKNKLLGLERRAFRIIGSQRVDSTVVDVGEDICRRLFQKVVANEAHPLRCCFLQTSSNSETRNSRLLKPIRTKTTRLANSFVRFGR